MGAGAASSTPGCDLVRGNVNVGFDAVSADDEEDMGPEDCPSKFGNRLDFAVSP